MSILVSDSQWELCKRGEIDFDSLTTEECRLGWKLNSEIQYLRVKSLLSLIKKKSVLLWSKISPWNTLDTGIFIGNHWSLISVSSLHPTNCRSALSPALIPYSLYSDEDEKFFVIHPRNNSSLGSLYVKEIRGSPAIVIYLTFLSKLLDVKTPCKCISTLQMSIVGSNKIIKTSRTNEKWNSTLFYISM